MTDPHLFWTVFAAVLGALLLAGMFFGSMISYSRYERNNDEASAPIYLLAGVLMPILFLMGAFWIIGF